MYGDRGLAAEVIGRVEAAQSVMVSPQFSRRITEVVRHEGDLVKQGEVLARLADTADKSDVLQQQAALSSREHDLAAARCDRVLTMNDGRLGPREPSASRIV